MRLSRRVKFGLCVGFLFAGLNIVAYRHAWRMTHFVAAGQRTPSLQKLSALGMVKVLASGVTVPKPAAGHIDISHRTVTLTTRDGVTLEAWDVPADTNQAVAVMFHGYATAKGSLRREAAVLRDNGCRTVLVDLRGSGGSDGSATTLGWREALDVAAATHWARQEWPNVPVILYGQSLGAAAVLRAIATEALQPDAVILECPFDRLLTTVGHRYHTMHLPAFPFANLLVFWGGVQHGFNVFRHNPVEYARSVTCPALVLDGARDAWVTPTEARRVADAISGPATCHIFRNGGHTGYCVTVPEQYRKVVKNWLAQRPAQNPRGALANAD